ncbi:MAG: choice-of-anchor J domain-containing protein [Cryomorphaceae bacterium]
MKNIYLWMLAMVVGIGANAQSQIFFDDFEDQSLEGYTLYNLDGLVPDDPDLESMEDSAWTVRFISSQGWTFGNSAFSVSWYEGDAGPSNDWLISPAIEIGSGAMLEWDAMAITSSGDFRDRYQVFIGSSAELADYEILAPVFDTGDTGEVDMPIHRMIDLAELGYENETIHIAFRNTTEGFDPDQPVGPGNGGNELAIDNIEVSAILSTEEPKVFRELRTFPNPARENAHIAFRLESPADALMEVIDVTGKVLRVENLGRLANGDHLIEINRSGLANGLYIVRLRSGESTSTARVVLH